MNALTIHTIEVLRDELICGILIQKIVLAVSNIKCPMTLVISPHFSANITVPSELVEQRYIGESVD